MKFENCRCEESDLEPLPSMHSFQTSQFKLRTSSPALVPMAIRTVIHAIPVLQSAASVTAVFSSVLYSQTSSQECVLQRTTFATVRCMRRRWNLPLTWRPNYRRLFRVKACSTNRSSHEVRGRRTIKFTGRINISPEATNSLRLSWPNSNFNDEERILTSVQQLSDRCMALCEAANRG